MRTNDPPLTYGGGWLDRAGDRRTDPEWVASLLAESGSRIVPVWRDRCLMTDDEPVRCTAGGAADLLAAAGDVVFLGLDGDRAVFAVDLSDLPEDRALNLVGARAAVDVRTIVGRLPAAEAALHGYARGVLHWHRHQRFCGTCGGRTDSRHGGHVRRCAAPGCGRLFFPRIEPAVIVLVEAPGAPDRCLLARHAGAAEGSYSTLAGFVEIGESLEDAVRRELAEEAGVEVGEVTYQASQAWPFPAGLMVGFRAVALSDRMRVDGEELVEARWFTRADLRARARAGHPLGRVDSIDRYLLHTWLSAGD